MNTKALIFICLLGYINSQAMKSVCMMDILTSTRRLESSRNLQAVKPTCPLNKDMCCDAKVLGTVKTEWMSTYKDIGTWFAEIREFVTFGFNFFDGNDTRIANWKNNTVCKGKKITPLTRRLQAAQPQCQEATDLHAALGSIGEFGKNIEADSQKCLAATYKLGAGGSCNVCNKIAPANLSWMSKTAHKVYINHKSGSDVIDACGRFLQALSSLNPLINSMNRMVPSGRRLQKVVPKNVDYFGFNVDSCMDKVNKGRRLQALKKDSVQSYKECADLSLWYLNNLLMNGGSHKLRLNPAMMSVFERVVGAIGTDKAKGAWKKVKDDVRNLQKVTPKPQVNWEFAFNAGMTGFVLSDLAPTNTQNLN